jgi:hypothetical protein
VRSEQKQEKSQNQGQSQSKPAEPPKALAATASA